jgi:hypothetical protein
VVSGPVGGEVAVEGGVGRGPVPEGEDGVEEQAAHQHGEEGEQVAPGVGYKRDGQHHQRRHHEQQHSLAREAHPLAAFVRI